MRNPWELDSKVSASTESASPKAIIFANQFFFFLTAVYSTIGLPYDFFSFEKGSRMN